jgi:hypothetical protein
MQASELCQLSVLTRLQKVALGYADPHGDGVTADNAAAGWCSVPGLQQLLIAGQQLDPRKETLECLGKLTGLTRLEWVSSFMHKRPEVIAEEVLLGGDWEEVGEPPESVVQADAGLHRLAAALPTSLRELTLDQFVSGEANNEPRVLYGLQDVMRAVPALPCLVLHTVHDDACMHTWSSAGRALFDRILAGEGVESDELQDFATDFWAEDEPVYVDDSEGDVCSADVSVEVMAADPVSEEYGGVYDDDDAVWEGDEEEEAGPV